MVMKPGKGLCYIFLLDILVVDPAQNLVKYKRWLCVLIQPLNQKKNCDYVILA